MGTPIPPEPFEIDPAKMYTVVVDAWNSLPFVEACNIGSHSRWSGPLLGQTVIDWLDAGNECTFNILFGPPLAGFTNRIFSMTEI